MENDDSFVPRSAFEALRNERDQLLVLLRALPDISFVIDADGLYVQVIGGANESMYADGKPLEGHLLQDALPSELANRSLSAVRHAINTGEMQTMEYQLQPAQVPMLPEEIRHGPNGQSDNWFEGRVLPLPTFDHAKPVALWVAVNITPRKQLEHYWRNAAHTDSLTGLANRQRLLERAAHEVDRAHRHGRPLSFLMIDVDHFKRINDHHGHAAGDEALQAIARACSGSLRGTDFIGRTGGEEFAVVLPETDLDGARQTAERLVETVREVRLPMVSPDDHLAISVGGAGLAADDGLDHLMRRADDRLYKAKAAGRDRFYIGSG